MLSPKNLKYRKAHKGRIHGKAKGGSTLNFGAYGLKALTPERVTARQIAIGEALLVLLHVACEPPGDGPDGSGVEGFEQDGVRHEARDAAVAVEERVNPEKAVVRGGGGEDGVGPAEIAVDFSETLEESRHCAGTDGEKAADFHVARAQLAGDDCDALFGVRVLDEQQVAGEEFVKAPVCFADRFGGDGAVVEGTFIDPALDGNVSQGLHLQITPAGIPAVVLVESTLDIDGMGIVAFDEVGVVAVYGAHEAGERGKEAGWQAPVEAGGFLGEIESQIDERAAMAGAFGDEQGLDERQGLVAVRGPVTWPLISALALRVLQQSDYSGMSVEHGEIHGRLAVVGADVGAGAVFQQEADGGFVAVLGGGVERAKALLLGLVDVGAAADQQLNDGEVTGGGGGVERGDLHLVGGGEVDVGALIDEVGGDVEIAEEGGEGEGGETVGGVGVDEAAALEDELLDTVEGADRAGFVQIERGSGGEEEIDDFGFSVVFGEQNGALAKIVAGFEQGGVGLDHAAQGFDIGGAGGF